jgi:hypothetical protein
VCWCASDHVGCRCYVLLFLHALVVLLKLINCNSLPLNKKSVMHVKKRNRYGSGAVPRPPKRQCNASRGRRGRLRQRKREWRDQIELCSHIRWQPPRARVDSSARPNCLLPVGSCHAQLQPMEPHARLLPLVATHSLSHLTILQCDHGVC